jgi:hypothetical protein
VELERKMSRTNNFVLLCRDYATEGGEPVAMRLAQELTGNGIDQGTRSINMWQWVRTGERESWTMVGEHEGGYRWRGGGRKGMMDNGRNQYSLDSTTFRASVEQYQSPVLQVCPIVWFRLCATLSA